MGILEGLLDFLTAECSHSCIDGNCPFDRKIKAILQINEDLLATLKAVHQEGGHGVRTDCGICKQIAQAEGK